MRIVIVGGGFGGLAAASAIGDRAQVYLVDRSPWFEFLPNIHQIVSAQKTVKAVRLPRKTILAEQGQTFIQDDVLALRFSEQKVDCARGTLAYDALVLAPGGQDARALVPGALDQTFGFRSATDAEVIRQHLDARQGPTRVTVVGGGFTGVELLGELLRRYGHKRRFSWALVESQPRLLAGWPEALAKQVVKKIDDVYLALGQRVLSVNAEGLALSGRFLSSDLTIWAAGAQPSPLLAAYAGPGGVPVAADLSLPAHPHVFLAGDALRFSKPIDKQASQALRLGARAGKNALRRLMGRPTKSFERQSIPLLLTLGERASFLVDGEVVAESPNLAVGRELIFLRTMAQLDQRSGRSAYRAALRRLERSTRFWWPAPGAPLRWFDD